MDDVTRKRGPAANFVDRAGRRYGKLVVIRRVEDRPTTRLRKNGHPYASEVQWLCHCDCGNETTVTAGALRAKYTSSCGCSRRKPRPDRPSAFAPGRPARNTVFRAYRREALKRGLAWELTDEQFDRLTSGDCLYCDCPPSSVKPGIGRHSGDFTYNGIDRKDNMLGYVDGNVVSCCSTCNHAKKDMTYDEFMAWIARLTEYHFFHPGVMPSRLLREVGKSA
jgi:hypothetical protein